MDRASPASVEEVVERLCDGDSSPSVVRAADRVLRRAEPVASLTCRAELRGTVSAARVEELVQDTLEIVWRRLAEFESGPSFDAWVRGIARHVCANERRRRRDVLTTDGVVEVGDPAHDVLRRLQREDRHMLLSEAIAASLDAADQDVVYHRYVHQLDREQIADLVGLEDAEAVRVVLQRATRRLRSELLRRLEELGHGPSLLRSEDR